MTTADEDRDKWLEAGRKLFAGSCDFLLGAAALDQIPDNDAIEVAFAGRSNVGKSSLINALTGRKNLARISNTPGRTRQLNYFSLGADVMLVDMPGHGYARASKKLIADWTGLVRDYLRGRPQLRRVFLLIDSRHGLKPNDREVMAIMDVCAVAYQIVMTKCDKLNKGQLEQMKLKLDGEIRKHPAVHPVILVTSSRKGDGLEDVRAEIARLGLDDR